MWPAVLSTYALELSGMVCLLGAYMLPLQNYVCAKTKDPTAIHYNTKIKDIINTIYNLYQWCPYIAHCT